MYKTSTSMKDEGGSNIYFVHVSRYRTLNQHKLSVFSCIYVCGVYKHEGVLLVLIDFPLPCGYHVVMVFLQINVLNVSVGTECKCWD